MSQSDTSIVVVKSSLTTEGLAPMWPVPPILLKTGCKCYLCPNGQSLIPDAAAEHIEGLTGFNISKGIFTLSALGTGPATNARVDRWMLWSKLVVCQLHPQRPGAKALC